MKRTEDAVEQRLRRFHGRGHRSSLFYVLRQSKASEAQLWLCSTLRISERYLYCSSSSLVQIERSVNVFAPSAFSDTHILVAGWTWSIHPSKLPIGCYISIVSRSTWSLFKETTQILDHKWKMFPPNYPIHRSWLFEAARGLLKCDRSTKLHLLNRAPSTLIGKQRAHEKNRSACGLGGNAQRWSFTNSGIRILEDWNFLIRKALCCSMNAVGLNTVKWAC